jgi:hypothetical protein
MPGLVIARMMSRTALKRFWALTVECQAIAGNLGAMISV